MVVNTTSEAILAIAQDWVRVCVFGSRMYTASKGEMKVFSPSADFQYFLGPGWDINNLPPGLVVVGEVSEDSAP